MLTRLILYFLAGSFISTLDTIFIRFISERKAFASALLAFISVLVSFSVLYDIIANPKENGWIGIVVYALGVSVGAYVGTRLKTSKEPRGE